MRIRHSFRIVVVSICVASGALGACSKGAAPVRPAAPNDSVGKSKEFRGPGESEEFRVTGPYSHDNLVLFLVHGPDVVRGDAFITLQEALDQKKIVVHETGDVQSLAVENVSDDEQIFIQAGDIVRGGRQDRVLTTDLLVSAKSGKIPINSFCVEQGRWQGRGQESTGKFDSSSNAMCGNRMKLAVKDAKQQGLVWKEVANAQAALADSVQGNVADPESPSSLELTMSNDAIRAYTADYTGILGKIVNDKPDVVGYVAAINGKLNCADVYGSNKLFGKLWPKMLKATAIEALGEREKDKSFEAPSLAAVRAFLAASTNGKTEAKPVSKRVTCITTESDDDISFDTIDEDDGGRRIHRNVLSKKFNDKPEGGPAGVQQTDAQRSNQNQPPSPSSPN